MTVDGAFDGTSLMLEEPKDASDDVVVDGAIDGAARETRGRALDGAFGRVVDDEGDAILT